MSEKTNCATCGITTVWSLMNDCWVHIDGNGYYMPRVGHAPKAMVAVAEVAK